MWPIGVPGFVTQFGAEKVIDYKTQRFEDIARDIDLVFDTVGGDTFQRSFSVLKPDGRVVTIAASAKPASDERTKKSFFIVEPNQVQLIETAKLLDSGVLKTAVGAVLPLTEASAAYDGLATRSRIRGKLVVTVARSSANSTATA